MAMFFVTSRNCLHRALICAVRVLFLLTVLVNPTKFTGKGPLSQTRATHVKHVTTLKEWQHPAPNSAKLARQLRDRRAVYRAVHFERPKGGAALLGGSTFCEDESVSIPVRNGYLKRVTNFRDFALTTLSMPANMLEDNMIAAMLEYIDELFFAGFPVEDGRT